MNVVEMGVSALNYFGLRCWCTLAARRTANPLTATIQVKTNILLLKGALLFNPLTGIWEGPDLLLAVGPNERFPYGWNVEPDH